MRKAISPTTRHHVSIWEKEEREVAGYHSCPRVLIIYIDIDIDFIVCLELESVLSTEIDWLGLRSEAAYIHLELFKPSCWWNPYHMLLYWLHFLPRSFCPRFSLSFVLYIWSILFSTFLFCKTWEWLQESIDVWLCVCVFRKISSHEGAKSDKGYPSSIHYRV